MVMAVIMASHHRTFGQKERVVFVDRATHGEVIIGLPCEPSHENPKKNRITTGTHVKTENDNMMTRIGIVNFMNSDEYNKLYTVQKMWGPLNS